MAVADQVVDLSADPLDQRRRRRRAFARIGVPILGLILVIAAILGIAVYGYQANRAGALALSDDVLTALDGRVKQQVSAFLDPCARALSLLRDLSQDGALSTRRAAAEALAASALRAVPQIANVSLADQDGNYLLIRRGDNGGTEIKQIVNTPTRVVTWIHRAADGHEIGRTEDPKDTYDPRSRPWYQGAMPTDQFYWTGIYVFFTDHKPGLTVSNSYRAADGRLYTFGIDIDLDDLSHFLASLQIGRHGRAMIIDSEGHLIAFPDPDRMLHLVGTDLNPAKVDQLQDPAITGAYDRFRTQGPGRRVITVDDTRYITTVSALNETGRNWWLLMTVPETDFTGFVASNNRTALTMSLVIVFLAAMLATLLVRQGLRADRAARLLLDRSRLITRQSAAYASLAAETDLLAQGDGRLPPAFTETLADMTNARRASIWQLLPQRQLLRCADSYDRDSQGHVAGSELHHDEMPQFFSFLQSGTEAVVSDAATDRHTAQFHRVLMHPFGSRSLLIVPIHAHDAVIGAICIEDAAVRDGGRDFVRTVASMLALRLSTDADHKIEKTQGQQATAVRQGGERNFTVDLASRSLDTPTLAAAVYSNVAVMVLRLPDQATLAKRSTDDALPLADTIACQLQGLAEEQNIPYLKFVGEEAVAAAGFDPGDDEAMTRIANLAVAIRDRCSHLLEDADLPADFRIGIDCGLAIGSAVGKEPRLFNLWGDAVRTADIMAGSATPGAIQATEAAYGRLRQDFLFRPRGSFYLPHVGEARTFVLAGQL